MKVKVLASGSKGNSTYVEDNDTRILIDIGMNTKYIVGELNKINVNPDDIDAIIITHEHTDHIAGLKSFIKKYNTKVYISDKMNIGFDILNKEYIKSKFTIKNMYIQSIKTSHDVVSFGYIIQDELVYITDTGYINEKYFPDLKNKKLYVMESNHDIEKLMDGPYPYHLKQRILSDKGHLSNETSSIYLSKLIGSNTKYVILAHLSETNNTDAIARCEFSKRNKDYNSLIIASQNESTELLSV